MAYMSTQDKHVIAYSSQLIIVSVIVLLYSVWAGCIGYRVVQENNLSFTPHLLISAEGISIVIAEKQLN